MAAVAPGEATQLENRGEYAEYDMNDSDLDAEGEDDPEVNYAAQEAKVNDEVDDLDMSDADAEGEEVDDDEDDAEDDVEEVGAVKMPLDQDELESADGNEPDDAALEDDDSDAEDEEESDKESSEAESGVEKDWEAVSEGVEEAEVEVSSRNNCM